MRRWLGGALVAALVLGGVCMRHRAPARVATFNLRDFPESDGQIRGAFTLLAQLEPSLVAMQEIGDARVLAEAARQRLGPKWRTLVDDANDARSRVALLVDGARLRVDWARVRRETMLDGRGKAVLEARVIDDDGGPPLRVLVVHLKAGGSATDIATRAQQLRALADLAGAARASGDEVVLLGDFNATSDADREAIAKLADASGLDWASRRLACTSYWNRDDGCRGTALDHVLTTRRHAAVVARGPCETEGCTPGDRCPAFHRDISDHCPVTVD